VVDNGRMNEITLVGAPVTRSYRIMRSRRSFWFDTDLVDLLVLLTSDYK
jgi:hypothetical protein